MIFDTTVFKKNVSTCLKETSPLSLAQKLKQCCSHIRENACSSDMSTLAPACITTWKPSMWLHNTTHYNSQFLNQQQWQTNIWNISRYSMMHETLLKKITRPHLAFESQRSTLVTLIIHETPSCHLTETSISLASKELEACQHLQLWALLSFQIRLKVVWWLGYGPRYSNV